MHSFGMLITSVILLAFAITSASSNLDIGLFCKTQCTKGCCPHDDGVCCEDGFGCCRKGQTCIPHVGLCMGLTSTESGNLTLNSERVTPVENPVCPGEVATACSGGCCPYPDAVCCDDGNHCCPGGFNCSTFGCESNNVHNRLLMKNLATSEPDNNAFGQKLKELGVQICPDKLHLCPGTAECCRGDNGKWDCCPKTPALRGECCYQLGFIWICCTDLAPKCYWWGCWFA